MHNLKDIRKNKEFFKKKFSERNTEINLDSILDLDKENRDLILMGGYTSGQDPELDEAVSLWPRLMEHIKQPETERADFKTSNEALINLMN